MKKIYLLSLKFCKDKHGAIAVSFAFMLPALIGFFSIAVDGSRFNAERSRLNDALNQSVYAVAITDNRNATKEDKKQNAQQAARYLTYYFPDKKISLDTVSVSAKTVTETDTNSFTIPAVDYQVNANVISHPILSSSKNGSAGFSANITIHGSGLSGVVRRTLVENPIPGDYVFVVDFSGSMTSSSAESGYSRERLLKKVVRDVSEEIFDLKDGSTIGIVPFSYAVPVKLDKTNYVSNQSKEYGCSYIGKMKGKLETLDWNFWYNKPGGGGKRLPTDISEFVTKTDDALKDYYYYIAELNGQDTERKKNNWLIDRNYCREYGRLLQRKLRCDADPSSDIHNALNQYKLNDQYNAFKDFTAQEGDYTTILNEATMDIAGTLSGDYLFDVSNVRTMISFHNSNRVFGIPPNGNKELAPPAYFGCNYASPIAYGSATLKTITKPKYYLMNLSDNKKIIDEFEDMSPEGGTNSLSGLLRSVPLIAQGKNPRKIIYIISDGQDDNPQLRRTLMIEHNLCGVIKDGLKKYPANTPTKDSDIYYISLIQNSTTSDWAANCVGQDHAFIATNIDELKKAIKGAMYKNKIEYINPKDIK